MLIDALNESEQEEDVRQMIRLLVDLSKQALEPDSICQLRFVVQVFIILMPASRRDCL